VREHHHGDGETPRAVEEAKPYRAHAWPGAAADVLIELTLTVT
jgi:hypothetical protein